MQDKFFDTDDQLIEDLFIETDDDNGNDAAVPAIQIVRFDENDRPAGSETRPLSSFL